jgi:hypothetical protein
MQSFEALYRVPVTHRLVPVRSCSHGGRIPATYWEHEDYDTSGRLVARYESFAQRGPNGDVTRGSWRKVDPSGRLIGQGSPMPSSLAEAA